MIILEIKNKVHTEEYYQQQATIGTPSMNQLDNKKGTPTIQTPVEAADKV